MASAEAPSGSGTPPQARNGNSPQSQPPIFPLAPTAGLRHPARFHSTLGHPRQPPRPPRWRLRLVEPRSDAGIVVLTPRKRRPLEFVMTLTTGVARTMGRSAPALDGKIVLPCRPRFPPKVR